jgi:hypothetical protein
MYWQPRRVLLISSIFRLSLVGRAHSLLHSIMSSLHRRSHLRSPITIPNTQRFPSHSRHHSYHCADRAACTEFFRRA